MTKTDFLDNSTLLFTTDEHEAVAFLNISWVGGREHLASSGRAQQTTNASLKSTPSSPTQIIQILTQHFWHKQDP